MKKILCLISLSSILLSQDTLTAVGNAQYNGKVIEVREYQIVFLPDGATTPQVVPKWNIISIQMSDGTVLDYSDFTEVPEKMLSEEAQKISGQVMTVDGNTERMN